MATPAATVTAPPTPVRRDISECQASPLAFLDQYGQVYDASSRTWVPFRLWDSQIPVLDALYDERLLCLLKARQLGMSWLVLGYALWLMLFWPAATVLVFSKREEEAVYLLGEERLRGMWRRLPEWLRAWHPTGKLNGATAWSLANGSVVRAFPANAGDSYTATLAVVDEADLVHDLETLLSRVKPTVDAGGKLVLLSRADKSRPESPFKRIYRAARDGPSEWKSLFLPWSAHPGRDAAWYARQRADVLSRTGNADEMHEQYPATDEEALARRTVSEVFKRQWFARRLDALPVNCTLVRYWDKAYTSGGGCFTAGVLMGRDRLNQFYVIDVQRRQVASHEREALILATAQGDRQRYGYVTIWVEQEPAGIGRELCETTIRNLAGFDARPDPATGKKEIRALPFAAQCGVGNVTLLDGPWNAAYVDELCLFPEGEYMDQVDASSGAFAKLAVSPSPDARVGLPPPRPVPEGVFGRQAGCVRNPPPGVFGK